MLGYAREHDKNDIMSELILPTPEQLKALCGRWKFREPSLFGSQARREAVPDSDVDLLVEYEPTADWSLLDTLRLRAELAELFGRRVDLVRERNVANPYRLASIRRDRRSLYAA